MRRVLRGNPVLEARVHLKAVQGLPTNITSGSATNDHDGRKPEASSCDRTSADTLIHGCTGRKRQRTAAQQS